MTEDKVTGKLASALGNIYPHRNFNSLTSEEGNPMPPARCQRSSAMVSELTVFGWIHESDRSPALVEA